MNMTTIYNNAIGRFLIVILRKIGVFRLVDRFLRTRYSKKLIPQFIEKNNIDMQDFRGREFASFADFFSRKKESISYVANPEVLISPCDGQLTIYPIQGKMNIAMKGSYYRRTDLIPDAEIAKQFIGGLCLVFRLDASDYHHFCVIDNATISKSGYVPGELHSVQPIACEKLPVYRLNRRWWNLLYTTHFGAVAQIEVGAMLVGGVRFEKEFGWSYRGEEMGNFELAGSTIILMVTQDVRKQLKFYSKFRNAENGACEVPVKMGEGIGALSNETDTGFIDETDIALVWGSRF